MDPQEPEPSYDLGLGKPWSYSQIQQRLLDNLRVTFALERVGPEEVERARVIGGLDDNFSETDLVSILNGDNPLLTGTHFERIGYYLDENFGGLVSGRAPDFYLEAAKRWEAKRQEATSSQ